MSTDTAVVIDSTTSGDYGTYYPTSGSYFAELGIWNPNTAVYSGLSLTAGSDVVTGFSSTAGILPGMTLYSYPDVVGTPWPTVVSVGQNSIVLSGPSSGTFTNEALEFGLANNGVMYDETITSYPSTFPNGTVFTWSFPSQPNNASVYAYPNITFGPDPYYSDPPKTVASLKANSITNLSVTYNVSVNAAANTYDCLIETHATSVPDPTGGSYFTNEIGFLAYTPTFLANWILSLPSHFSLSVDGFSFYIATRPGTVDSASPPETLVMPVTSSGGTTPVNMISGTYTVPLDGIMAALISNGILSPNSYINDFQFGFEVAEGSGSATINSLSYNWNSSPTITSMVASPSSADLNAGKTVTFTLNLNEAVTVTGTPTLSLNDGGTATYAGGSGTDTLTFSYTVGANDSNVAALIVTQFNLPNGAAIANGSGNAVNLLLAGVAQSGPQVDTTTPTVTSISEFPSSGDLNAGKVVTITLNMSEAVTVNASGGSPTLTLNDGGTATYTGGSGSKALTFSYTVAVGQNTPGLTVTGVDLNSATIADLAGNNASFSGTFNPTGTLQIDTTPPAAPVITGEAVHGNKSVLSGSAEASSKITIYEGTVILGTTTANSSGSWTFNTGPLSKGSHTFTATATDAAGNTSVASQPVDPVIGGSLLCEINSVYEAVLQCAPTDAEVTASLAINLTLGSAGMIAAIVNSAEAITNVYPILQIFNLATGHLPSAATLASMVDAGLTLPDLAADVVGSQTFANTYNSGALVNPNSPLTAGIVEALYSQALGHAPTEATLNGWLNSGLTVAQAFQEFVTSQSYFATTQLAIEQYLTTAANNNAGNANSSINSAAGDLTATQIETIYEAVLQRAPTATEVTASLALDSTTADIGVIAALVDSATAINNVYPILQMFELAFGHFPGAATLGSMVDAGLTVPQLAEAIVGSQTFGNIYNNGTPIDANSPVTAAIVEALYGQALGHAPTQATLNAWLGSGWTVAQAFDEMVTSQSYFETTQTSIEQDLTAAAINEAGLTTINGTQTVGALTLGTAAMPLTQTGLTVLGGSGSLTVVASGAGDTITELNSSTAGSTIAANGAGDTITAANGANTISANGAGDTISLGAISSGTSITSAQTIHAAGVGDVVTFATQAADGTAITWAAASTVDGGNSSTGIGANSTVNFGNNTGGGSEMVVVTGDMSGATTSGGTSTAGIATITLGNVVDAAGDQIIFNNATTEVLAGTSAVNVTAAGSLAQALDTAASAAGNSQSGGMIPANTGVIDWFQYGANTYVVEAINGAGATESHPALTTTDEVIKIVGLINLAGESLVGHALTL